MKIRMRQALFNVFLSVVCIFLILLSVFFYCNDHMESSYNRARLLLGEDIAALCDVLSGDAKTAEVKETCYVLDLTGTVRFEFGSDYAVGEQLNVSEAIQTDNSFYEENKDMVKVTFPLERDGSVAGFAVFLLDKELVLEKSRAEQVIHVFSPLLAAVLLLFIVILYRTRYLTCHFIQPMEEISASAKEIVKGNFDRVVVKNHSLKVLGSVTDEYVYAFELMRDELQTREQREKKLKRLQKEMMSCISHDLKTPISTIRAYSEGIRDGLAADEATREEYVATIIYKTEVMSKMIKDLLDQTNAEINELSIEKKERYAEAYFDKIIRELTILTKQKGIAFCGENRVPDLLVSMDEERITQVIYNLVENSIKYMDKPQKEIRFLAEYDKMREVLLVTVADNGPGIGMADIPFVFDKFYRAEKSRNMSIPGAGLGLSICKYIVEAHGGEITIESKTKDGCTVTFTILV